MQRSAEFYDALLAPLDGHRILDFGEVVGFGTTHPPFWLGPAATGGEPRETHIAFAAVDRAAVGAFHSAAVEAGDEILNAPQPWPEYHDSYFAVFVRDPDGNNVEAVRHRPPC